MGKNNRARRAAKAKQRKTGQRFTPRSPGRGAGADAGDGFGLTDRDLAAGLFELAAVRSIAGDDDTVAVAVERLGKLPAAVVNAEVERALRRALVVLWDNGWQPAEIVRQVRRDRSAAASRLAAAAVVSDHADRRPDTLDPTWAAQVDVLRAGVLRAGVLRAGAGSEAACATTGWFTGWCDDEAVDRCSGLAAAVSVLAALFGVGRLAELIPPPGRSRHQPGGPAGRANDPVLARVRALLAQAESTTFPAEAEAFTAKAHELMTRYAIDQAVLGAGNPDEQPSSRRIGLDDPYVDAKSYLLQVVAEQNRCRAVFDGQYAMSTVVGFRTDLDATELLFTSLLVQAQLALTAEARNAPAGAHTRGRSFRSSFLVAYAGRVGQRLAEINQAVLHTVEAETQRSALPVLAARRSEVDERIDEMFGRTIEQSAMNTRWDGYGAMRGKLAGDNAQLAFADLTDATAR